MSVVSRTLNTSPMCMPAYLGYRGDPKRCPDAARRSEPGTPPPLLPAIPAGVCALRQYRIEPRPTNGTRIARMTRRNLGVFTTIKG